MRRRVLAGITIHFAARLIRTASRFIVATEPAGTLHSTDAGIWRAVAAGLQRGAGGGWAITSECRVAICGLRAIGLQSVTMWAGRASVPLSCGAITSASLPDAPDRNG